MRKEFESKEHGGWGGEGGWRWLERWQMSTLGEVCLDGKIGLTI